MGSGARAVLAMAFVAVVLAFLASGGSLKGASLAGAVVLASPTLFDVATELCVAPKKMLVSSSRSSSRALPRLSLLSQPLGCWGLRGRSSEACIDQSLACGAISSGFRWLR